MKTKQHIPIWADICELAEELLLLDFILVPLYGLIDRIEDSYDEITDIATDSSMGAIF